MRLIDSFVEIIPQEPTFEGALKAVELAARVSHLSEEKITDGSYKEFCDKLLSMGHLSPFEFGTVYLTIPSSSNTVFTEFFYRNNKYSKTLLGEDKTYVTTNLRVIYENNRQKDLKYLTEPTDFHQKRINTHWICSRAIQQEVTRHRVFSFLWESTRWIGYDKDKFGSELTFVKPAWYWSEEDSINHKLACARFEKSLQNIEDDYLFLREKGLLPQDARHILPLALKSEGYVCGFENDWKGKNGFFEQRASKTADPDIQVLTNKLVGIM